MLESSSGWIYVGETRVLRTPRTDSARRSRRAHLQVAAIALALLGPSIVQAEPRPDPASVDPLERPTRLLSQNRLEQAEPLFRAALETLPQGSEDWVRAAFGLANILHQYVPASRDRIEEAKSIYERLVEISPGSDIGIRSRLLIGCVYEWRDYAGDTRDFESARPYYLEVVELAPQDPVGVEAALRYASTYIKAAYDPPPGPLRDDWEAREALALQGVRFLEAELVKREPSPFTRGAWEFIGEVYGIFLQDWQPALEACLRATGDYGMLKGEPPVKQKLNLDRINPGYMYWRIGQLALRTGHEEIAKEYFTRIIIETPVYKSSHARRHLRQLGVPEDQIPEIETFVREEMEE